MNAIAVICADADDELSSAINGFAQPLPPNPVPTNCRRNLDNSRALRCWLFTVSRFAPLERNMPADSAFSARCSSTNLVVVVSV